MPTHLIDSARNKARAEAVAADWAEHGEPFPAWDKRTYSAASDPALGGKRVDLRPTVARRPRRPVERTRADGRVVLIWCVPGAAGRWEWHAKTLGERGPSAVYSGPAALLRGLQGEADADADTGSARDGHPGPAQIHVAAGIV